MQSLRRLHHLLPDQRRALYRGHTALHLPSDQLRRLQPPRHAALHSPLQIGLYGWNEGKFLRITEGSAIYAGCAISP